MSARTHTRPPAQGQLLLWHMDPAAAAWVRDVVLTRRFLDGYDVLIALCPCMWGRCGHCPAGRHQQCPSRRPDFAEWRRTHHVSPETYLTGLRGYPRIPVWRAHGPPCRWICPCRFCAANAALPMAITALEQHR